MAWNVYLYASHSLEKIMSKWLKRRPVLESLLFRAIQWLNSARAKTTKKGLRRMKLIHHGAPDFSVVFFFFYTIIKHLSTFSLCSPLLNPTVNFFKKFNILELTISVSGFMVNVEFFSWQVLYSFELPR